jgi:hypothetical protein
VWQREDFWKDNKPGAWLWARAGELAVDTEINRQRTFPADYLISQSVVDIHGLRSCRAGSDTIIREPRPENGRAQGRRTADLNSTFIHGFKRHKVDIVGIALPCKFEPG